MEQERRNAELNKVFSLVDQMPEFPGGRKTLDLYLQEHINFPAEARKDGIQGGRVIVQFIVEKDGSTSNHKIVRSVHPALDREVVRVLESMPKWLPGKQHNENVRTYCTIPHLVIDK